MSEGYYDQIEAVRTAYEEKAFPKQKTPTRQGQYAQMATLLPAAIDRLKLLLDSSNPSVKLGAVKVVVDKCLPDIKAVELSGHEGKDLEIKINIVKERQLPAEVKE